MAINLSSKFFMALLVLANHIQSTGILLARMLSVELIKPYQFKKSLIIGQNTRDTVKVPGLLAIKRNTILYRREIRKGLIILRLKTTNPYG